MTAYLTCSSLKNWLISAKNIIEMVAPYEIGDPVRSFVRVPGSGTDKNATPLSWDLSRSSTVAAAVPVQQTFPSATPITSPLKPAESLGENAGANSEEHGSEAPTQTEEASQNSLSVDPPVEDRSEQSNPEVRGCKRRYIEESGTIESSESNTVGPSPAKSVRVSLRAKESTTNVGSSTAVGSPVSDELAKVMEERDQLCQENLELKAKVKELDQLRQEKLRLEERLTLFHDLFKNKNRLAMLLRRLNMHQYRSSHH